MADVTEISFVVEGQPKPKQRPRINRKTGKAYTPKATQQYQRLVRGAAISQMAGRPQMVGDLAVEVTFYRKTNVRADVDNLVKGITDPLNGLVWEDDRQIVQLVARVIYGADVPRAEVKVRRVA